MSKKLATEIMDAGNELKICCCGEYDVPFIGITIDKRVPEAEQLAAAICLGIARKSRTTGADNIAICDNSQLHILN